VSDQTQEEVVEEVAIELPEVEVAPEVGSEDAPEVEAAVEEYTPNYSYKAYGEEKSFPKWVTPLIINKDAEEEFRTLFAKSGGFDGLKSKHDKMNEEFSSYQSNVEKDIVPIMQSLQEMKRSADINDFESFFKSAGVNPTKVFQWAVEKARYQEMAPEERQAHDSRMQMARENSQLKYQNQDISSRYEDTLVEQRERELNLVLEDPTINTVMQEFDSRKGKVGSFREEVISYARGKYLTASTDISSREAVEGVLSLMGRSASQQAGHMNAPQQNSASSVVAPRQHPVIPNLRGGHTSPIKKAPQSIEELRKLAEDF